MIIQAARKVFCERGYHNAQVSDIVREAGISTGSLYTHFKDKRDLFEQVSIENLENLRLRLLEIRKTENRTDIRSRVERMKHTYHALFDYVEENPMHILMIIRGGFGVDERLDMSKWGYFNAFAEDIADEFRKWERSGIIEGINASLMGHIVIGTCLHVVHSYLMNGRFTRREAIHNLIALNQALFTVYLTDKGKEALGDLNVSMILE